MEKPVDIKLHISPTPVEESKNADGSLGAICNNCGGLGFTMNIKGGKLGCKQCDQTGIKMPSIKELQQQIDDMKQDLSMLRTAVLETLEAGGMAIPKKTKEALYV